MCFQESRVRPLLPALMRPNSAATLHSIRLMTSNLATLMCLQHASNVLAGLLFVVHKGASGLPVWSDLLLSGYLDIYIMLAANRLIWVIGYRQRQDEVHR